MTAAQFRRRDHALCLLALGLTLSACAQNTGYPSLARRPAETMGTAGSVAVAEPSAPSTLSADVSAKLAELIDTSHSAHARFTARRTAAERAAAGAGPLGSDSWAAASIALAGLEEAVDQQSQALGAIDQMQVDQQVTAAGAQNADTAAIAAAREQVAADADADGEVVTRLRVRLGGK